MKNFFGIEEELPKKIKKGGFWYRLILTSSSIISIHSTLVNIPFVQIFLGFGNVWSNSHTSKSTEQSAKKS